VGWAKGSYFHSRFVVNGLCVFALRKSGGNGDVRPRTREDAMAHLTTQNTTPLQTIFGAGYVLEAHGEKAQSNLPFSEVEGPVSTLVGSFFDEVLKSLRGSLLVNAAAR
jgi:hypothetical protein